MKPASDRQLANAWSCPDESLFRPPPRLELAVILRSQSTEILSLLDACTVSHLINRGLESCSRNSFCHSASRRWVWSLKALHPLWFVLCSRRTWKQLSRSPQSCAQCSGIFGQFASGSYMRQCAFPRELHRAWKLGIILWLFIYNLADLSKCSSDMSPRSPQCCDVDTAVSSQRVDSYE